MIYTYNFSEIISYDAQTRCNACEIIWMIEFSYCSLVFRITYYQHKSSQFTVRFQRAAILAAVIDLCVYSPS